MDKFFSTGTDDFFKCIICLESSRYTHLCNRCAQPFCYECITKWLTSHTPPQCPHCKNSLHVETLVNCRWCGGAQQLLALMKKEEKDDVKEDEEEELKCLVHNEKLGAFCTNCKLCICLQCAAFDKAHRNHDCEPLKDAYLQRVKKIDEVLIILRRREGEIKNYINIIEQSTTHCTNEIENFRAQINSQLEKELMNKVSFLDCEKNKCLKKCTEINAILESSRELEACTKSELMLRSQDMMQRISELTSIPKTSHQSLCAAVDEVFPSELIPPYDCSTFIISNFASFQLKAHPIYSPPLQVYGLTWRLKVCPAGSGPEKYLSVLLQLSSGLRENSKFQYKVELIHSNDPTKTVVEEFTSEFSDGECWGFHHFYLLDKLVSDGYLKDDKLELKFSVRPVSYYLKSKIQDLSSYQLLILISLHCL